ncbi:MAG TPA: hypothetical protein VFO55_07575 [Gemmatimonadaceae bacterium]|nr:hypothetical protein [Gemmatimonadaceae bacterium]
MNDHLRQRIQRRLESLPDDRGYQILDYIEFLETKYADRSQPAAAAANPFTKFTEAVEDRLRAGKVSANAIAETVGLMNKASSVLNSALAATKTMANELAAVPEQMRQAASSASPPPSSQPSGTKPASPGSTEASSPAHETRHPGSGEEKL